MIITTVAHGRTRRDSRNLLRHLAKTTGQTVRLIGMDNVLGRDAAEAVRSMEVMRDGSRAEVAFHHLTLSPRERLTDEQRDTAVARILTALGAEDHGWVLIEHDEKKRAVEGVSDQHFHLVVGHVGPDLKALDMGGSYARLEAVARGLEMDWGETLTDTRRHEAVAAQAAKMGREDVAEAVMAMRPEDRADLPQAAMSSATRQRAERNGLSLPQVKEAVRAAWEAADGPQAFRAALAEQGLELAQGRRQGVWMVMHGEVEVGALDRLVKQKRAEVAQRMEQQHERTAEHPGHDRPVEQDGPSREGRPGREAGDRPDQGFAPAYGRDGRGTAEPRPGGPGAGPVDAPAPADDPRRDQPQAGQDRAARAHLETVKASLHPDAKRLVEMARSLAIETDPMQRHARAMERDLGRAEELARQRLQEAQRAPQEPRNVIETRERVEATQEAARAARRAEREAQAERERLEASRPKGLVAWVMGRTGQHRRDEQEAQRRAAEAIKARKEAEFRQQVTEDALRSAERRWADRRAEIVAERDQEAREARQGLKWIEDARKALKADPALGRSRDALQERVEEERRRQAQERTDALRRAAQEARERAAAQERAHRPSGPRMR